MKHLILLSLIFIFFCATRAVQAGTPAAPLVADSLVLSLDSVEAPTCLNGDNGALYISVSGGTAPYNFIWSNGETTEDLTGEAAGLYSVSVTDDDNNTAVLENIFLPDPVNPVAATLVYVELPGCIGQLGSLGVQVSGDAPPFEVQWGNGESTDTISGLQAGIYDLIVKDANGCTATYSYTLEPQYPIVALSADGNVTCSHPSVQLDGSASVLGSNTIFEWNATNGGAFSSPTDVLVTFTSEAGTYSLTLTDTLNGCVSVAEVDIIVDKLVPVINAGLDQNTPCTNSALTLNGSALVGPNHSIAAHWTAFNGGHIAAGGNTLTPGIDHAGTYVLEVHIVENGCSATDTTIVTGDNDPPSLVVAGGTLTCISSDVILSTQVDTMDTSFGWTGPNGFTSGELNPSVSEAGNYVFTITDTVTTCTSIASATVLEDTAAPDLTATGGQITCAITAIELAFTTSATDISWTWEGPNGFTSDEPTPNVNESGDYTLTVTNTGNGCTATAIATVTVDSLPPFADAGADINTICTNSVLSLLGVGTAAPNYSITTEWTAFNGGHIIFGANTLTPDIDHAGTYVLTVQAVENGCSATDTIIVTGDNDPPLLAVAGGTITCFSPAVLLTAQVDTMNTIFGWAGPNGFNADELDTLVTEASNYVFTVTDTLTTCTSVATAIVLADNEAPVLTAAGGDVTCVNASVILTFTASSNAISWSWDGPNGYTSTEENPEVTEAGDYTLSVLDTLNGCSATTTVAVVVDTIAPIADAGFDATLTCVATSLQLGGAATSQGADFAYAWTTVDGNIAAGDDSATPTVDAGGTYLLTVSNTVNGCTATDMVVVDENNTIPLVSAQGGTINCLNSAVLLSGSFISNNTVFGWTGPNGVNYNVLNPVVNVTGNYILTITDTISGCSNTANAIVDEDTVHPLLQANGGFIGCTAAPVTLTAIAFGNNISYAWVGPNGFTSNLQNPSVTMTGTYTVTATNGQNGCTSTVMATVILNTTPPVANAGTGFSLNCNVSSGKLNGTGSSQGIGITYAWTTVDGNIVSGTNTLMPTVNAVGTYVLTVTNTSNGCTASASTMVTLATPVTIFATGTDATCYAFPSGSATAVAAGGTGNFNYVWSNGVHVPTANGLFAGNYTVTATDGNGCTATASVTIGQPASALSIAVSATPETAPNANDGTASVNISGGTIPYLINWSNNGITPTIIGLAPGAYTVVVTDLNGCSAIATANVNAAACALTGSLSTTNVDCFGGATGSATIMVANETDPIQYNWSNGTNQPTASNLTAGTYEVSVTDASACSLIFTFEITQPTQLTVVELFHNDASCPSGAADGSLTAAVNGGTQPYSYAWSTGSTTATASGLIAGTYTLVVTDANGCETSLNSTILGIDTEAPDLVLQNITIPLTANGTANLDGAAFDAGSSDNCGIANWSVSVSTVDCSQIGAQTVMVTATDGSGNETSGTAELTVVDITAPTLTCPGNLTVAACNSTVNFSLPNVSDNCGVDMLLLSQIAGLPSGSDFPVGTTMQSFEYTDASGNTGTCSFNVTVAAALSFSAVLSDVSCAGACDGAVNLNVFGGMAPVTVAWSNGGDGTGLCAGTYSAVVADAGGCSSTLSFTITEPQPLALSLTSTNPACPNDFSGSIQAVVTGGMAGYNYAWSNGSTGNNLTDLGSGVYTVVVTDFNGCSLSEVVTLVATDTEAPTLVLQNASAPLGANGSVSINPTLFDAGSTDNCGIANWTVSPNTFDCGDLGVHVVTVTATDASGNSTTNTANLTVMDNIAPVITCPGNIAVGACNPTATFTLPTVTDNCPLNPTLLLQTSGLPSGSDFPSGLTVQTFSYTDMAGNQTTCSFAVTVAQPATITPSFTNATCNGVCNGTATIAISGGLPPFSVAWSNGQTGTTASNLCDGAYEASVTDGTGCLQTLTFTITEPTALQLTLDLVVNDVNSAGVGGVQISMTGGVTPYSYSWTRNGLPISATSQDLANLTMGNYVVVVTDANGCSITSQTIAVQNLTGVKEPQWAIGATLQPNPASQQTMVVLQNPLPQALEVQIFDGMGRLVKRQQFSSQTDRLILGLSGLASGVYNVQLRSAGGVAMQRLVIGN